MAMGADHRLSPRTIQLSGQGLVRRTGRTRLDGEHRRAVGHEQHRWRSAHA